MGRLGWLILAAVGAVFLMSNRVLGLAVKAGVVLPLTPEMKYAEQVVARVWAAYGMVATITSGTDGEHKDDSLHYIGLAEDFRTHDIPSMEQKLSMVADVRAQLGVNYDVILEYLGLSSEHMHVEYDPKG
jgi:hypothetical protein